MFNAYDTEPEKILLAVAFDATDGIHEGYWSTEWNGPTGASKFVHRKNDDLDSTYELLTALAMKWPMTKRPCRTAPTAFCGVWIRQQSGHTL